MKASFQQPDPPGMSLGILVIGKEVRIQKSEFSVYYVRIAVTCARNFTVRNRDFVRAGLQTRARLRNAFRVSLCVASSWKLWVVLSTPDT